MGKRGGVYQKINSKRPHSVVFDNMELKFKPNVILKSLTFRHRASSK